VTAEAFEAFVRAHQNGVYATALRLLGNPAEAEDVAQTVFLKAFERFDEIAHSPAAAGWLRTVARNACLNHLSRYRRRWRFFSELAGGSGNESVRFEDTIAADATTSRALERVEEVGQLEQALRALPDHQRVPLVLFHLEDASYEDIASALGVSLAKVKSDIHRGREALRRHLTSHGSR
jgi:RNA polymerase sigma-70 factor (ECF subfamily)